MNHTKLVLIGMVLVAVGSCLEEVGSQPTLAAPPEIHCKHFIYGYPLGTPPTNDLIIRDCYALSSNDGTKFADWVCCYLTWHEVDGDLDLERNWRNDPWLDPSETLEASKQDDYAGANKSPYSYDRGHLAPLASFKGSRFASQVNSYSNIVPQKSDLNQGPWQRLESKVRDLVRQCGAVWVMTGPIYETAMPPLPNCDEPHKVPSAFWQVVAVQDGAVLHVAAFIMEQDTDRKSPVINHLKTVDEVEQRTGLDFFWELPDTQENALEAATNLAWAQSWVN